MGHLPSFCACFCEGKRGGVRLLKGNIDPVCLLHTTRLLVLSGRYSNLTLRSCLPSLQIPIYVGDEYEALRDALSAWEEASVKEVGEILEGERAAAQVVLEAAWRDLRQSAHALASVVQVATAQLKGVTAAGVLLH